VAFGSDAWRCVSAVPDSAWDEGLNSRLLRPFRQIRLAPPKTWEFPGCMEEDAFRYWILTENDDPRLCLSTDGRAFDTSGSEADLVSLYKQHKRMAPLIQAAAGSVLP
jgi:hypothetical protein